MIKYIIGFITAILVGTLASFAADYTPASTERAAQVDTNLTIVVTNYTPAFVGQVLIGIGSNTVHIAQGTSVTNWVKVSN